MSDESPDTATAEGAPDASPAGQPPSVPDGNDDGASGGQLDIATLPDQAQEYIRELREEAKQTRIAADPAKKALAHYNAEEQAYLIQMIDTMGVDEQAGATAFIELGKRMGGIDEAAAEVAADPEVEDAAAAVGMTRDEMIATVRQEMEQDKLIAAAEQETRDLGFEPYTPEADKLWDLAIAMQEDDLSKVAPAVRMVLGLPEPEGAPAKAGAEVQEDILGEAEFPAPPDTTFPATPTIPSSTGDVSTEERTPPPALGSQELRDRVMRRFEQANKPG